VGSRHRDATRGPGFRYNRRVNGENPWAPWGLIYSTRDGRPVLTETAFWHLTARHPETIERVGETEVYIHLDQPYQVVALDDRAFRFLCPAPGRKRPATPPKP